MPPREIIGLTSPEPTATVGTAPREITGPAVSTRQRKKHHGGLLGAIGESFSSLAGGAERSVVGIPNALVTTGRALGSDIAAVARTVPQHPERAAVLPALYSLAVEASLTGRNPFPETYKKVIEPVGKSYAYKYGPLFQGHPGKSAHRALVEDPFGTILDLAAIATTGSAAAAKALPAEATALRELPLRGPEALAKAGRLKPRGGGQVSVIESEAPWVIGGRAIRGPAIRERAVHAALNRLPANTPIVGELRRYNRALAKLPQRAAQIRRLNALPLDRKLRKLSTTERQAVALLARWPLPRLLEAQIAKWRALDEAGALKIATDPKVRALYDDPPPKLLSILEEARRLGETSAEMLGRYGRLNEQTALDAPYLHMRATSGAVLEHLRLEKPRIATKALSPAGEGTIVALDGDVATLRLPGRNRGMYEREFLVSELRDPRATEWIGGEPIERLQRELETAGRPQPVYLHDTALEQGRSGFTAIQPRGGGRSPTPPPPTFQNEQVLASLGQLLLDPSTLIGQHLRNVKYGLYRDIHSTLERQAAVRVPKGTKLPDGWDYLRRAVGPTGRSGETIPYTERTAGEYHRRLEELLPDAEAEAKLRGEFTTRTEAEAGDFAGDRLIVPSSTIRALTGEFERSSRAARWLVERPLDVWRAILLNWSPRWLTNNVVGNTFMGLLRFGGARYVREWLRAVREHGGPAAIEKLLRDQETAGHLTATDIAELFPGQVVGTFKGQNMPYEASVAVGRLRNIARQGLSPIDRGYEQALRRAAIRTQARRSPEVIARYKAMPKEERSWRAATKEELARNPTLVKKIEQEVNSGLGDFTSLSPAERNWLRRLVPFYGWYRAVTTVVLRLPVETPLRVRLIAQLSNIQQEDQDLLNPNLRQYLRGSVPVAGGGILRTQGINPYATVPQVGRALVSDPLGVINPYLQAIAATGRTFSEPTSLAKLLDTIWQVVYGSLPPAQAVSLAEHGAPPSKLYRPSTLDQLLGLAGIPLRHPVQALR